jgi:endonuclease/exonuclease/phosphatase (EEP) superfamily protein YafD
MPSSLFFVMFSLLLIALTIMPLSTAKAWWIRATDFPRLQLAILAGVWLITATLMTLLLNKQVVGVIWWLAVTSILAYQLWWIWPSSPYHGKEVQSPNTHEDLPLVTILSANVLMDNRDSASLITLVEQYKPDVLVTMETNHWWQQQLDTLTDFPHRLAHPLDNKYGMHLYSRLPLSEAHIEFLVSDDIPSMNVKLDIDGTSVRLHVVHPTPPAPGENDSSEERDVELLVLAQFLKGVDTPTIVTGDLNDVAWSKTTRLFRSMSGLLDPRTGRGMFNTFHADYWFLRWPLDHVFVSKHWCVNKIERLPHIGSDHFPMYIELSLLEKPQSDIKPVYNESDHKLVQDTLDLEAAQDASNPKR